MLVSEKNVSDATFKLPLLHDFINCLKLGSILNRYEAISSRSINQLCIHHFHHHSALSIYAFFQSKGIFYQNKIFLFNKVYEYIFTFIPRTIGLKIHCTNSCHVLCRYYKTLILGMQFNMKQSRRPFCYVLQANYIILKLYQYHFYR